jgi:hypothetical protein
LNWKNPFAAPSQYKPDLKAVEPGALFISEASGGPRSWIGKPLVLHASATAIQHASKVRQVRLFRLGASARPISLADRSSGDCDLYVTTVLPILHVASDMSRLESAQTFSSAYLNDRTEGGKTTLVDARWLAVFETTEDSSSVFRILKSSTDAYFAGGWSFTLQARAVYSLEEVRDAQSGRMDVRSELARRDKTVVCHIVEMLQVADSSEHLSGPLALAQTDCGDLSPPTP